MANRRCICCASVGDWTLGICPTCMARIGFDRRPCCYICSRPLRALEAGPIAFCRECQGDLPFGRVMGIGLYRPPLSELIHRLKFEGEYALGPVLGALLASCVHQALATDGLSGGLPWQHIVPVPVHPARKRQRGYNQAGEVARGLAAQLDGLPVDELWLQRLSKRGTQVERSGVARRRELAGAFGIVQPSWWHRWRAGATPPWHHHAVLLVDDVFTTGSTARSCARVLLAAGAIRVDVAVCAISATTAR